MPNPTRRPHSAASRANLKRGGSPGPLMESQIKHELLRRDVDHVAGCLDPDRPYMGDQTRQYERVCEHTIVCPHCKNDVDLVAYNPSDVRLGRRKY